MPLITTVVVFLLTCVSLALSVLWTGEGDTFFCERCNLEMVEEKIPDTGFFILMDVGLYLLSYRLYAIHENWLLGILSLLLAVYASIAAAISVIGDRREY